MGLDMYLTKRFYVGGNWEHRNVTGHIELTCDNTVYAFEASTISEIIFHVLDWRKANQIHKWFVKNVQEEIDDCRDYWVSNDQLKTLKEVCQKIIDSSELIDAKISAGSSCKNGVWTDIIVDGKKIKDPQIAHNLLPTTDGFFFGNTDYDQVYYKNVKMTLDKLNELDLDDPTYSYYYYSSW